MTADRVREIVAAHTRLAVDIATLADGDDLYSAGLTSHANVNLMLALEDAFDIEFPERLLRRQTFESITAISAAIDDLALEFGLTSNPASHPPRSGRTDERPC